jgi:hypothetical protein
MSEVCGWGGLPRCRARLPRRGLCDEHRAALARVREECAGPRRRAAPTTTTPLPPPVQIDPSDVLDPGDRNRIPAAERAAHLARWVARVGRPVRRADAVRVAGLDPMTGAARGVLREAEQRGWVARFAGGAVAPGSVLVPDKQSP